MNYAIIAGVVFAWAVVIGWAALEVKDWWKPRKPAQRSLSDMYWNGTGTMQYHGDELHELPDAHKVSYDPRQAAADIRYGAELPSALAEEEYRKQYMAKMAAEYNPEFRKGA